MDNINNERAIVTEHFDASIDVRRIAEFADELKAKHVYCCDKPAANYETPFPHADDMRKLRNAARDIITVCEWFNTITKNATMTTCDIYEVDDINNKPVIVTPDVKEAKAAAAKLKAETGKDRFDVTIPYKADVYHLQ